MAYIGKIPATGAFQKCDALTATTTADYTLQVGSTNVVPESVNHMIVSLNGVIQSPTTAFTVANSTLSFSSALTANDTIDFVMLLGNVLDVGTVSDDTITLAKMAGGTDGNIISYDASGNPVAIATGSDGQVLTSAGAGQPPAFEAAAAGGKVGQVVQTVITTAQALSTSTTKIDLPGYTVAITPTATSSKVLVSWKIMYSNSSGDGHFLFLNRDTTEIGIGTTGSIGNQATIALLTANSHNYWGFEAGGEYLDSPSTTSATTYKFQIVTHSNYTCHFNRSGRGNADGSFISTMTAMEILA